MRAGREGEGGGDAFMRSDVGWLEIIGSSDFSDLQPGCGFSSPFDFVSFL